MLHRGVLGRLVKPYEATHICPVENSSSSGILNWVELRSDILFTLGWKGLHQNFMAYFPVRHPSKFYGLFSCQAPKSDFLLSPIEFLNVLLFIFMVVFFYEATKPVNHMTDMIATYCRRTHYCQDCYRFECLRWDQSGRMWRRRGQHLKSRSLFSLRKANLSKTKQTLQSGELPCFFDQVPAFSH